MPVKRVPAFQAPRGSVRQAEPFQFRTEPPRKVTAQMSVGDGALAAVIQLCGARRQRHGPRHPVRDLSASGLPLPPTSVPPRNQAWPDQASTTRIGCGWSLAAGNGSPAGAATPGRLAPGGARLRRARSPPSARSRARRPARTSAAAARYPHGGRPGCRSRGGGSRGGGSRADQGMADHGAFRTRVRNWSGKTSQTAAGRAARPAKGDAIVIHRACGRTLCGAARNRLVEFAPGQIDQERPPGLRRSSHPAVVQMFRAGACRHRPQREERTR